MRQTGHVECARAGGRACGGPPGGPRLGDLEGDMRPRTTRGRRIVLVAAIAMSALLAACGPENRQNSLQPKGDAARKIDHLMTPVAFIAIVVGILVVGGTIYVGWRFRFRAGVNENPKQIHGNSKLEITWTIIPALVLAVIAVPTVSTIFSLAKDPGPHALQVKVVAKQWWWSFQYPDEKVVTADELVIPAGRKVELTLEACDETIPGGCNVIHSFWPAELAGKKDVVPGHKNKLTISADEPGTYLGQCAEYCGLGHADMRFRVIAMTNSDFDEWVSEQQQGPVADLTTSDGKPLAGAPELIGKFGCTNCHIFDDSSKASYGPNLTHLASRDVFAGGAYALNRANLVSWLLDAPSMVPMESQDCRKGLGIDGVTCVGMPSFTKNTPKGQDVMTRSEAQEIADFLLGQD